MGVLNALVLLNVILVRLIGFYFQENAHANRGIYWWGKNVWNSVEASSLETIRKTVKNAIIMEIVSVYRGVLPIPSRMRALNVNNFFKYIS